MTRAIVLCVLCVLCVGVGAWRRRRRPPPQMAAMARKWCLDHRYDKVGDDPWV